MIFSDALEGGLCRLEGPGRDHGGVGIDHSEDFFADGFVEE